MCACDRIGSKGTEHRDCQSSKFNVYIKRTMCTSSRQCVHQADDVYIKRTMFTSFLHRYR